MMKTISPLGNIERRSSPRIAVAFPIKVIENSLAKTVNFSENGICFALIKPLFLKFLIVAVDLPSNPIRIKIEIIWNKTFNVEGKFIYGARIINPDDNILASIRKALIYRQLKFIIKDIKDKKNRQKIVAFAKAFKHYLYGLVKLTQSLENKSISRADAKKLIAKLNNEVMWDGGKLESEINQKLIIKKIKHNFRTLVSCWAYKSFIVKRSFDKPRGYPGDYKTLEIIYNNRTLSKGIGWCFDQYFLNNEYSIAVRNRKDKMKEAMLNYIEHSNLSTIKILDLACGSCREIREMLSENNFINKFKNKRIIFTLVDQDDESLEYSKKYLKNYHKNIEFNFLNENLLNFIKNDKYYKERLGRQNFIYTIGLADYFPDRILGRLIRFCFELLTEEGKFIITHKDIIKYKPLPPDWFCDWSFYPRSKDSLLSLIKSNINIEVKKIKISSEPSQIILFFSINK